jgi:hypothetical protein
MPEPPPKYPINPQDCEQNQPEQGGITQHKPRSRHPDIHS